MFKVIDRQAVEKEGWNYLSSFSSGKAMMKRP
jgi:hypothetical protein